ncbi:MAG: hypothetical protein H0W20_02550 [Chthoniobacterales bacterium]|nr:hypothetical protein [Chthoniobacterales bacterium]
MGHSLAGYLSLLTAGRDPRIEAVVEASGAIDAASTKRLPPTLILHGRTTRRCRSRKRRLEALLKKLHTPYEKKIYPHEPHRFSVQPCATFFTRTDRFLSRNFPANAGSVPGE